MYHQIDVYIYQCAGSFWKWLRTQNSKLTHCPRCSLTQQVFVKFILIALKRSSKVWTMCKIATIGFPVFSYFTHFILEVHIWNICKYFKTWLDTHHDSDCLSQWNCIGKFRNPDLNSYMYVVREWAFSLRNIESVSKPYKPTCSVILTASRIYLMIYKYWQNNYVIKLGKNLNFYANWLVVKHMKGCSKLQV